MLHQANYEQMYGFLQTNAPKALIPIGMRLFNCLVSDGKYRKDYKKWMMRAKLTILILTLSMVHLMASSLAQQVTLSFQGAPLTSVLSEIKAQSGYDFVIYTGTKMQSVKPVSIQVEKMELAKVLYEVFDGQPLTYELENKIIVIRDKTKTIAPPYIANKENIVQQPIRGRVTNENGEPLAGASIYVLDTQGKRTPLQTKTDEQGYFYFELPQDRGGAKLEVAYLGYIAQKLTVRAEIGTVTLKPFSAEVEEVQVVNTGYQQLPRERSAGSFAQPDMELFAQRTGSINVLQRLDGLIPGLAVNNARGADQFQVRGLSTIGAYGSSNVSGYSGTDRSPLVVVDGVPVNSINDVNPQDVENVTVLKDATASSIWGSRASNGVIVIATKKGQHSGKIQVDYNMFYNFMGKPDLSYFPVLNSKQFITAAQEIFDPNNTSWATISQPPYSVSPGVSPHEQILYDHFRGLITGNQKISALDSLSNLDNRQQIEDLFYRNAILSNHTLSLRGGQEKYRFYGSLAYTDNRNSQPGNKNNSYKINLRQDFKPHDRVNLYLVADLLHRKNAGKPVLSPGSNFLPYQLFIDGEGLPVAMPWLYRIASLQQQYEQRSGINLNYVPLLESEYGYDTGDYLSTRINSGLKVDIFEGLSFEGTYGWNKGANNTIAYLDDRSYTIRNIAASFATGSKLDNTVRYYMPAMGGRYTTGTGAQMNWTVRNQFNYNKGWNSDLHQISALGGVEYSEAKNNTNTSTAWGFDDQMLSSVGLDYAALGVGIPNTVMLYNSGRSTWFYANDFNFFENISRFRSVYANIAYTFNRKYSINGSWRQDKSSLFGLDKASQNRPIWSVGGRYEVGREKFMSALKWLDQLAVRATYGLTGTAPSPGTAASKDIIASSTMSTVFPGGVYRIATPANRGLTWESTKTTNLGMDFSLLRGRLAGSIDVYSRKTSDLLGNKPGNPFSGYTTIVGNLGDLENKGIEASIRTIPVRYRDFEWRVIVNAAYNKNKITKLSTSLTNATGNAIIANNAFGGFFEGYAAYGLFAYKYGGLDAIGDPQIILNDGTVTKALNAAKPGDMVFMGTYQPKWSGGVTNGFSYKGLSLNVNIIANLGHVMRRDVNTLYSGNRLNPFGGSVSSGNQHADFANRWKIAGDEAQTDIPGWVSNGNVSSTRRYVNYYIYSDRNVVDASFLKMRDITLSYSVPVTMVQRLRLSAVSVQMQMGNIMLWKANKNHIDPEFITPLTGVRTSLSGQQTFSIGTNITF